MFAQVALLDPPFAVLTYALPPFFPHDFWRIGHRVVVPIGKNSRLRSGIICALKPDADLPTEVECRDILWPLEKAPVLPADLLDLALELASRHVLYAGQVLSFILPAALQDTRQNMQYTFETAFSPPDIEAISVASPAELKSWATAIMDGRLVWPKLTSGKIAEELCILKVEPPWPIRPRATRQRLVLDYLLEHGSCSLCAIGSALGSAAARAARSLAASGLVDIQKGEKRESQYSGERVMQDCSAPARFSLNGDQLAALAELQSLLASGKPANRLLHGVTGSGKTAVYLEVAKAALAQGKSVILLAPEVALASKLYQEALNTLPEQIIVFHHGYQTPARKLANFLTLSATHDPCLVIGPRSALFLPVSSLGCIIMDEEHDDSYKQDDGFGFHAKEVAWQRMQRASGVLLLGSATPDIKTYYAAQKGHCPELKLPTRIAKHAVPPIELVALPAGRGHSPGDSNDLLAPESEMALREVISRGEQAVVLLNRRGYSPIMHCLDCGGIQRCPSCQVGLTYHKSRQQLVCHYCGYGRSFPSPCERCGSMNFLPLGEGTERMAEKLGSIAGGPVLRLDRDSSRRPGSMDEILKSFAAGDSPILVGTQMISKGHHFPRVTLALVADGDLGLNLPDYRAPERTFQLLIQAAGRAGRGENPGRVIIQTRDMNHYCWEYIRNRDYGGFYSNELERRKRYQYPPFICLALLRLSFKADEIGYESMLEEFAALMRAEAKSLGLRFLGPSPAPLAFLRGRRRFQCLLKAPAWLPIRRLYFFALKLKFTVSFRLSLDLDPVNML